MKQVKSILKGKSGPDGEDKKQAATAAGEAPATGTSQKAPPTLIATADLTIEQVRATLQNVNKMLRKQAQPAELASLLKIKEVREILDLHKANPKESSERINQYQKDLAARLRAHDRSKRPADADLVDSDSKRAKSVSSPESMAEPAPAPVERKSRRSLTGVLSQAELAVPPSELPSSKEFNLEWIQYFFQLMCSKTPFFSDSKLLVPGPSRLYVEESEEQRVFVDGLSSAEIVLLLNFVYDLESNLRNSAKNSIIVPNRAVFLTTMGDPLESGLLDSWYFSHSAQCATCALRFGNRKLLTIHHDYHYQKYTTGQRRKRGLENNFRGWMESPQDFLGNKEVQFGFDVYNVLDSLVEEGSEFLAQVGISGNLEVESQTTAPAVEQASSRQNQQSTSHTARTVTQTQVLSEQILPDSVPVDEIKNICLECGDPFERVWVGEPVDMAVYRNAVALPTGSATPLQFQWPIQSVQAQPEDLDDMDRFTETIFSSKPATADHKVEAANALFDHRFVNAMLFHKDCFANNESLKEKSVQFNLLTDLSSGGRVIDLLPPTEVATSEPIAVIEEVIDDDLMLDE